MAMMQVFLAGGPVMFPLLLCSMITLAVIIERGLFWWRVRMNHRPDTVARLARNNGATESDSDWGKDVVARVLNAGCQGPVSEATLRMQVAAGKQLSAVGRNLGVLDTMVALAPLLGIFGTVLGIIQSFQLLGEASLTDPVSASRGLAQALITTAFGLAIAMPSLIAFKYFQTKALKLQQAIEERCTELEHALGIASQGLSHRTVPELQHE